MLNAMPQPNPAAPAFGFLYRPEQADTSSLSLDELSEVGDFSAQLRALILSHYQQQNIESETPGIDVKALEKLVNDLPFDLDLSGDKNVFQQLSSWLAEQGLATEWAVKKPDSLLGDGPISLSDSLLAGDQADEVDLLSIAAQSLGASDALLQTESELDMKGDDFTELEVLLNSQILEGEAVTPEDEEVPASLPKAEVFSVDVEQTLSTDSRANSEALQAIKEGLVNDSKPKPLTEALQAFFDRQIDGATEIRADKLASNLGLPLAALNVDELIDSEAFVAWAEQLMHIPEADLTPEQQAAINILNAGLTQEAPLQAGLGVTLNQSVTEQELSEEALLSDVNGEIIEVALPVSPVSQMVQASQQAGLGSSAAATQPNFARQVQPTQPSADKVNVNAAQASQLLGQATPTESAPKSLQETLSALLSNQQNQSSSLPQQAVALTTRELLAQQQQEALRASELKFNASAQAEADSELLNLTSSTSERKSSAPSLASISYPLRHPQWAQSVGKRIVFMANQQMQQAQISLNPEKLGPIQLRLQLDRDQMMTVSMTAHHGTTREALEAAIPRLKEMLEAAGIAFDEVKVEDETVFEQSGQQSNPEQGRNGLAANAEDGAETEVSAKINTENMIDYYA